MVFVINPIFGLLFLPSSSWELVISGTSTFKVNNVEKMDIYLKKYVPFSTKLGNSFASGKRDTLFSVTVAKLISTVKKLLRYKKAETSDKYKHKWPQVSEDFVIPQEEQGYSEEAPPLKFILQRRCRNEKARSSGSNIRDG